MQVFAPSLTRKGTRAPGRPPPSLAATRANGNRNGSSRDITFGGSSVSDFEDRGDRGELTLRQKVWFVFEDPSFSPLARMVSMVILAVIILSVIGFLAGSLKGCRWTSSIDADPSDPIQLDSPFLRRVCERQIAEEPWASIELTCILIFTLEYVVRFFAAGDRHRDIPSRKDFVLTPLNVIDLIAIAPWYIELVVRFLLPGAGTSLNSLSIVRVLRLTRVLRVFKVSRSFTGIVILMRTLQKSVSAIAMLLFFVLLCVVVFAALIFYAEQGEYYESCQCYLREDGSQSPFESILAAGWFCLVTMTTVGYGDHVPVTGAGKVVASMCMVCGLIVISLPITIIGANFDEEYKTMEIEKRNRTLKELHKRHAHGRPGASLALIEQLIDVHKQKLQSMLGEVEAQMDDQAAQMEQLLADLREQLSKAKVPIESRGSFRLTTAQLVSATQAGMQRGASRRNTRANLSFDAAGGAPAGGARRQQTFVAPRGPSSPTGPPLGGAAR